MYPPNIEAIKDNPKLSSNCRSSIQQFLNPDSASDEISSDNQGPSVADTEQSSSNPCVPLSQMSDGEEGTEGPIPCERCGIPDRNNPCQLCYERAKVCDIYICPI